MGSGELKQPHHRSESTSRAASDYVHQAERLGYEHPRDFHGHVVATDAAEAKFVTAQDPVIETFDGQRLPAVPVEEAVKLNALKDKAEGQDPHARELIPSGIRTGADGALHGIKLEDQHIPTLLSAKRAQKPDAPLREASAPTATNPLFPPVPVYGPASPLRNLQAFWFRCTSACLSLCFLLVIVLGALFTNVLPWLGRVWLRLKLQDPAARRPFYAKELERRAARAEAEHQWQTKARQAERVIDREGKSNMPIGSEATETPFEPTEGGPDPLVCDAVYYARRVGLDMEEFSVQTEDGFIIQLWHIFDPKEYKAAPPPMRRHKSANVFRESFAESARDHGSTARQARDGQRKYPVLLMHGLLQSAGAYCCTDDNSLAFYLAKSGYDVWLGNNRCGFRPEHAILSYSDPRMWAWNIRQMGVLDLPALVSRVLEETGFTKLGLICHSQGTTQTFVALAKEQRPDLGSKISVFCALAPAAYAGPLIKKMYFKFMQVISPGMFRMIFGIHSFIPFMMTMHASLPGWFYGEMGYLVFSFLFDWSDERWERDLRSRMFQFAPVYVSSESMRWWLGRECFAKQKCILSTRREGQIEDEEDEEERAYFDAHPAASGRRPESAAEAACQQPEHSHKEKGRSAWYDEQAPPFAMWVAGNDDLVDGRRLLKRFATGREPHVDVVHSKIIEGYEHLDVIWAMDSLKMVGKEVKEVLWSTCPSEAKAVCRVPSGCEQVKPFVSKKSQQGHQLNRSTVTDASKGEDGETMKDRDTANEAVREP